MSIRKLWGPHSFVFGVLLATVSSLQGSTWEVDWTYGYGFDPDALTINSGDGVDIVDQDDAAWVEVTGARPESFSFDIWNWGGDYLYVYNHPGTFYFSEESDYYNISPMVTVTVNPSAMQLKLPRIAAGHFLFEVTGLTVGKTNLIQASTNLVAWTSIKTNVAAASSATYTNPISTRFQHYRIFQKPYRSPQVRRTVVNSQSSMGSFVIRHRLAAGGGRRAFVSFRGAGRCAGIRLRVLPELFMHLNPLLFDAAVLMEKEFAEDLRRAGFTVLSGDRILMDEWGL
jgi:hypothetical protein